MRVKIEVTEWVPDFCEVRDLPDFCFKSGNLNGAVSKTVDPSWGPRVLPLECLRQNPCLPLWGLSAMYYVYILQSLKSNRFYYGSTSDLKKRLKAHNAGKVRSTKAFSPWTIHYYEIFATLTEALQRERYFKSIDGYNWLKEKGII